MTHLCITQITIWAVLIKMQATLYKQQLREFNLAITLILLSILFPLHFVANGLTIKDYKMKKALILQALRK